MTLAEVEEILKNYSSNEGVIEKLLTEIDNKKLENLERNNPQKQRSKLLSFQEAKERNKDIENVKGGLRSKAIFSPTEMQWESICKKYQEEPSLQVKTWRCNLPIFI